MNCLLYIQSCFMNVLIIISPVYKTTQDMKNKQNRERDIDNICIYSKNVVLNIN